MPAIAPPVSVLVLSPSLLSAMTVTVVVTCRASRDALVATRTVVGVVSISLLEVVNGQNSPFWVSIRARVAINLTLIMRLLT